MATTWNLLTRQVKWLRQTLSGSRQGTEDVVVSIVPNVVMMLTTLLASILMARGLGATRMGQYALVISVNGLVTQLSDLGINKTAIRFASRAAAHGNTELQFAVLRWALRLRTAMVVVVSVVAFAAAPVIAGKFWHAEDLGPLVRLSLLIGLGTAMAMIPRVYFQSIRRFRVNATVSSGQPILFLLGIVVIYMYGRWGAGDTVWTVGNVLIVSIITTAAGALAFLVIVPKTALFSLDDFRQSFGEVIASFWRAPAQDPAVSESLDDTSPTRFAFLMGLSAAIASVIQRADLWLMGYFLAQPEIGVYQVAMRLTLPLTVLLGALNTALWPRASALTSSSQTLRLLRNTFAASSFAALGGIIYAIFIPMLTPVLFGAEYKSGVLLGQLLCFRYCIALLACPIGVIGYSFGMVRIYWLVNMLQLIVTVSLSVLLLPRIGAAGAAIALIANDTVGAAVTGGVILKRGRAMLSHEVPQK